METEVEDPVRLRELRDPVKCCYKVSDTDVECLIRIVELSKPIDAEEMSKIMGLSKTTVETSLKRLMELGLVVRKRLEGRKIGRPKYVYSTIDGLMSKVKKDLDQCVKRIALM
ncbi:transcriptional regulator [Sulfodiicoccus acidiphilus]|uniref:Transcriptional regulator n=1 Tax=Sulfodiicoccus acidiphilus TaxID=1670455 RepID=A0A348B6Z2_9CREN|nr:helix-turn-helix domain-containing protein [Sulfodiicoccus acidiphilus]BBD73944.1 transcriptional regulator [Sulfodiicoccus acidiphilus]GGU05334.1 transcriptional regulator [Sulfodiicoccus acidiphilus]